MYTPSVSVRDNCTIVWLKCNRPCLLYKEIITVYLYNSCNNMTDANKLHC